MSEYTSPQGKPYTAADVRVWLGKARVSVQEIIDYGKWLDRIEN